MLRGRYDEVLVKMGREHGIPRGFPMLWVPDWKTSAERLRAWGFYPKFEQQNENKVNHEFRWLISELDLDAEGKKCSEREANVEVEVYRKYSGYLSILVIFQHEGNTFWTVTTKNSANFAAAGGKIADAERLWRPILSSELV